MTRRFVQALPARWRRFMRRLLREFPCRVCDLVPDLGDRILRPGAPLPPAPLRERVSGSSGRREFLEVGAAGSREVLEAFEQSRSPSASYPRWLDFGCGSGRLSRHLALHNSIREFWGVDIDSEAIRWDRTHLTGSYRTIGREPPVDLPPDFFDVIVAVSVFTHLDEDSQTRWLRELHRMVRPGGLLIATTHSPSLTFSRPDLKENQYSELRDRGFLFAPGNGRLNDDSAFHSREYLLRAWGELVGLLLFRNNGLVGYQDLSVWIKW